MKIIEFYPSDDSSIEEVVELVEELGATEISITEDHWGDVIQCQVTDSVLEEIESLCLIDGSWWEA